MKVTTNVRALCTVIVCVASVIAQAPWSFEDTLKSATDVVVGEIEDSSGTLDGSEVHQKATIHVVRVLHGDLPIGQKLALDWHFELSDRDRNDANLKLVPKGAIWFLRKHEDSYEPLQSGEALN
jgi:hypothetical protein